MQGNSILIAIQARSTSNRLPKKHHELLGDKRLLDHVIDACISARDYINRGSRGDTYAQVALLVPTGDAIIQDFAGRATIFDGPEHDVLQRYALAAAHFNSSHVVRITGDCPLIPPFIISKMIQLATRGYDYISNVDEKCRTAVDGHDCEVISRKLLDYLNDTVTDEAGREHVTIRARTHAPRWARMGFVMSYFDNSGDPKMSIDTAEDLERARAAYQQVQDKFHLALGAYPKHCIHRI